MPKQESIHTEREKAERTVEGLIKTAPVNWSDRVERMQQGAAGIEHLPPPIDRASLDEVIRHLDGTIQHLARLRGYLDARYGHGCGDQGHDDAVKESNSLVKKIRKALGFTLPGNDLRF